MTFKKENSHIAVKKPSFVTSIEGKAVEEGARVFFEGIVDAPSTFTWFFQNEEIITCRLNNDNNIFDDAEIHDSPGNKMSTLILPTVREHHMGLYTLKATNILGESTQCQCDMIVKRKLFPPVFWRRLPKQITLDFGSVWTVDVEVSGWPTPQIEWFKDDEPVESMEFTENWNNFHNDYVPKKVVKVEHIDKIHHSLTVSRISDGNEGRYTVRATNQIGEAECVADVYVNCATSQNGLYLPPNWEEFERLTWAKEDNRVKVKHDVSNEHSSYAMIDNEKHMKAYEKRDQVLNYLSSLPEYNPTDELENRITKLGDLPFNENTAFRNINRDDIHFRTVDDDTTKEIRKPSKFTFIEMTHKPYDGGRYINIEPVWISPSFGPHKNKIYQYRTIGFNELVFFDSNTVLSEVDGQVQNGNNVKLYKYDVENELNDNRIERNSPTFSMGTLLQTRRSLSPIMEVRSPHPHTDLNNNSVVNDNSEIRCYLHHQTAANEEIESEQLDGSHLHQNTSNQEIETDKLSKINLTNDSTRDVNVEEFYLHQHVAREEIEHDEQSEMNLFSDSNTAINTTNDECTHEGSTDEAHENTEEDKDTIDDSINTWTPKIPIFEESLVNNMMKRDDVNRERGATVVHGQKRVSFVVDNNEQRCSGEKGSNDTSSREKTIKRNTTTSFVKSFSNETFSKEVWSSTEFVDKWFNKSSDFNITSRIIRLKTENE